MRTRFLLSLLCLASLSISGCGGGDGGETPTLPQYTITDLGLPPDTTNFTPSSINDVGDVAGDYLDSEISGYAYVWKQGVFQKLITEGTSPSRQYRSSVYRINNAGIAIGYIYSSSRQEIFGVKWLSKDEAQSFRLNGNGYPVGINTVGQLVGAAEGRPVFWQANSLQHQSLEMLPGDTFGTAFVINDAGQIAGTSYSEANTTTRGFIRQSNGSVQSLPPLPGYAAVSVTGMNNQGTVVGTSSKSLSGSNALQQACLWTNTDPQNPGNYTAQPIIPTDGSAALGINASGQVVGFYRKAPTGERLLFLWSQATGLVDLDRLIPAGSGWQIIDISDINDAGQIIGYGRHNESRGSFVLTPIVPPM